MYPRARRFAAAVGDLDMDPDDVLQSALVACLRSPTFRHASDREAYLRSAIATTVTDTRRALARRRATDRKLEGLRSTDVRSSDVDASGLGALLEGHPPLTRALLYLVDVEGYSIKDAAEIVDMGAIAARSRLSRARASARRQLGPHSPEEVHGHDAPTR